jgi:DNA polymerase V
MYALVDCNSFFCSVEKVFHPGLKHKPVCVLSSNDGCIVALTPEAKALGIHRGEPIFKVRDIVKQHNVVIFSTNMYLYAAMSKRVTNILRKSVNYVENYSIDESFCCLDGYEKYYDLGDFMRKIAEKIRLYTDIPVSIGVAPTKTLAKMGSKFAKNYKGYRSVCLIDNEEKRRKALSLFDLGDVWGIGRNTLAKLNSLGVDNPLQLADKSESWVKHYFTAPMYHTWLELNGKPCIDTAEMLQNKSVTTTRSFGEMITTIDLLKASVATFASSCANKLRAQHSVAGKVTVYLLSNRFRNDLDQYSNAATKPLLVKTSDSIEITQAALDALTDIFKPGIYYKKAGVILTDVTDASGIDLDLFDPIKNRQERYNLMTTIDSLNHRFGIKTVQLAVEDTQGESWLPKCEHRSGNYLTDMDEILMIKI